LVSCLGCRFSCHYRVVEVTRVPPLAIEVASSKRNEIMQSHVLYRAFACSVIMGIAACGGTDGVESDEVPGNEALAGAPVLGPQKIEVFLINFQDLALEPYTPDQARPWIFGNLTAQWPANSATTNDFFKAVSFGKMYLTGAVRPDGDVFGWFTLPLPFPQHY